MKTKLTKEVRVKTNEKNPEPVEIIADAIIKVSEAFERMQKTRLTKRALLLLIHDNCEYSNGYPKKKPGIKDIEIILDSVSSLKKTYVK